MEHNVVIIGAGYMGSAFHRGFTNVIAEKHIAVCDVSQEKLDALGAKNTAIDPTEHIEEADIVLLAIKPQVAPDFFSKLRTSLKDKLVISIMAGITLHTLYQRTESRRIVRAMPNLAAAVNESVIGWVASGEISTDDKRYISMLFSSLGTDIECLEEDMVDRITPLSGSGPAFFFYMAEMIQKKAEEFGFSGDQARTIAEQTFLGAAAYFKSTNMDAKQSRQAVTSKGGITEAALAVMDDKHIPDIFSEALDKALERSHELSNE